MKHVLLRNLLTALQLTPVHQKLPERMQMIPIEQASKEWNKLPGANLLDQITSQEDPYSEEIKVHFLVILLFSHFKILKTK